MVASIRLPVRLFVCLCVFYTICMARSGRYMGSACRVLRKITMTHGIQPKISVCLSVIRKRSRSIAARSSPGLLIIYGTHFRTDKAESLARRYSCKQLRSRFYLLNSPIVSPGLASTCLCLSSRYLIFTRIFPSADTPKGAPSSSVTFSLLEAPLDS